MASRVPDDLIEATDDDIAPVKKRKVLQSLIQGTFKNDAANKSSEPDNVPMSRLIHQMQLILPVLSAKRSSLIRQNTVSYLTENLTLNSIFLARNIRTADDNQEQ